MFQIKNVYIDQDNDVNFRLEAPGHDGYLTGFFQPDEHRIELNCRHRFGVYYPEERILRLSSYRPVYIHPVYDYERDKKEGKLTELPVTDKQHTFLLWLNDLAKGE